jgi:hypothetical protein
MAKDRERGTAVVTGASGGIGLELARELAARGHDLVLTARSAERLAAAAAALGQAHGVRAEVVPVDLAEASGPARLAAALAERGVEPAILVNNAGVGMHGRLDLADPAALGRMLQLNVVGLTLLTRLLLPGMVGRRRGRILSVASTAGFVPGPFMAAYYASKAYVLSFSVALAEELRGTGVTATVLCPGPTRTGFDAAAGVSGAKLFRSGVMEAGPVARAGVEGLMAGRGIVVPGLRNKVLASSSGLAPRFVTARIARALQDPGDMA